MKTQILVISCAMLGAFATGVAEGKKTDMDAIRGRLVAEQIEKSPRDEEYLTGLVNAQKEDGTWGDVDYETKRRSGWPVSRHVDRLVHLARAYAHPDSKLHDDRKTLAAVRNALAAWVRMDLESVNWWHNQIGVPTSIAAVLLLTGDELPADLRSDATKILARSRECRHRTGQNLVWVSRVTLAEGVLREKPELVRKAVGDILSTVKETGKEGIQADASFHQHGNQLYSGGYGRGFLDDVTATVAIVRGTKFAADPKQVKLLTRLLLDGHQWMVYREHFDPGARGREISRRGSDRSGRSLLEPAQRLLRLDGREKELERLIARLKQCRIPSDGRREKGIAPLAGNRHFWNSDFMVHRGRDRQYAGDWYMSVKMHSTRTLATESGNGEALKNWYVGCGTMTIMNDHQTYRNIWLLLDWRKLPGTTIEQSDRPLPEPTWTGGTRGKHEFVGGVSDGVYGAAAYTHDRDGVKAYKAWFFVDDVAVCLGAGIEADGNAPVVTTIDQAYLHGEPAYGTDDVAKTLEEPYAIPDETKWVTNGRVGYMLLEEGTLKLDISKKSGKWQEINRSAPASWAESAEVMTLTIDHGVKP
ncbi:MAG: polysaccharide lyase family 8 super-sandwich domain-containing protein, partial [Phycisphaerae bacterium]